MEYLGLALFAEGPTDHRFLQPLLARLCEDLCVSHGTRAVEVSPVLELHTLAASKGAPRDVRIAEAADEAAAAWRVLFVHADGEGDPAATLVQQVQPAIDRIRAGVGSTRSGVAVVPVRETEAWVLADGDALRAAFGTRLPDAELGVPSPPQRVEGILAPKRTLAHAHAATKPGGRRARAGYAAVLGAVGEQASLDVLRQIPSFARMESELLDALHAIRVLD